MWYWGSHALQHLGQVIIVGGEPRSVRRLGFTPASTLHDALEMAADVVGRHADHHPPAQPADRHGRRHVRVPPRSPRLPVPVLGADGARRRRAARRPSARLGADYDTDWARRFPARFARTRAPRDACCARRSPPSARPSAPASTGSHGLGDGPVIFAANHHSHLDTPLLLTSIPEPWRHKVFVGAAADYFFRTRAHRRPRRRW